MFDAPLTQQGHGLKQMAMEGMFASRGRATFIIRQRAVLSYLINYWGPTLSWWGWGICFCFFVIWQGILANTHEKHKPCT